MLPELYQLVVCPWPGTICIFEIVEKKRKKEKKREQNLSHCQDQVSGEHYRTVGPLVSFKGSILSYTSPVC